MAAHREMADRTGGRIMSSDRTFERIKALFDIELFAPVKVLVAGCGSGGGKVAMDLVMSGIPNFTLLDHDIIGPENVIRHVCGRRFVGRKKVEALAELLWDRNPDAKINRVEADIMTSPDIEALVAGSDVVVLATDNEPSRYRINELCVRHEIPFVVGRVFTRGIGGEVFSYRPQLGGCLACLESALQRTQFRDGVREIDLVSEEEREKVYGLEIPEIKDSPGLAIDISFIAAFHSRFALDAIARRLPERPKYLTPIEENYLVWGNRPVHPFNRHFQLQRIVLEPQENCAVCSIRSAANV
jgi:molybdopterin/thiamine biosynthesis adenylyltransferase